MKIVLSKKVTTDKIREARFWNEVGAGLGEEFLTEFENALLQLIDKFTCICCQFTWQEIDSQVDYL